MRLIKPNNYDGIDMKIAFLGDAISHPVRKRILEYIFESKTNTKTDFSSILRLSKPVVAQHMQKLKDANLIRYNYCLHYQEIEFVPEEFEELMDFLIDLGVRPRSERE